MSMAAFLASLWKSSHLVELLEEKESFTLDLLDEEDILEEVKTENAKLIELIVDPQALHQILSIALNGLPETEDEKKRSRYPFVCCEILSLGVEKILSKLSGIPELLDLLFNTLSKDPPLDPILASRFARIASALLHKEKPATFAYLQKRANTVGQLAAHIQSPSIIELVLSMIEHENSVITPVGIVEWLHKERFVPLLLERLNTSVGSEYVAQLLVDLVRVSASHPSDLVRELQSQQSVDKLLQYTLNSASPTQLIVGLDVLIELLVHSSGQQPQAGGAKTEQEGSGSASPSSEFGACLPCVLAKAKDFYDILVTPTPGSSRPTSPFGFRRLKVLELFVTLLHTETEAMYTAFRELKVVAACLDIFFGHPWNNFIHHQVLDLILSILHGRNEECRLALFAGDNKLADRVIAAFKEDTEGKRKGYLGHLVKISNEIMALAAKHTPLLELLEKHEEWAQFVKTRLHAINELEERVWGVGEYESELSKEFSNFSLSGGAGVGGGAGPESGGAGGLHGLEEEDEDGDEEEDYLQREIAGAIGGAGSVTPTTAHLFGDPSSQSQSSAGFVEEEDIDDDEDEDDEEDDGVEVKPQQQAEETPLEELSLSPAQTPAAEPEPAAQTAS